MTDLDSRHPEFTVAIRGYDRLQVDEYIERLQQLVGEAEERARAAETSVDLSGHATVGPRISKIFELASEEARELRQKVEREAADRLAGARTEAEAIIDSARDIAQRTAQQGMKDYEAMLGEYEQECQRIRGQVNELEERKTAVLQELRRLYDALGAAWGLGERELREGSAGAADLPAEIADPPKADAAEVETKETKVLPRATSDGEPLRKTG